MKKTLLATTLLVATAGFASAEVTLSGSGRFGVLYSDNGVSSDTLIHTRLRVNIDAKMETDGGVTFGGRIRMQHVNGSAGSLGIDLVDGASFNYGAGLSRAMLYMEANGLRVEVGNANGAYDSAGLIWNSEVGLTDTSYGDPNNTYIGLFASGTSVGATPWQYTMGIFASYSVGDFTARLSYHDMDQNDFISSSGEEMSVSVDWASNGFAVSAAVVDGNSPLTDDTTYIGAAYTIGESTTVGLNYFTGDAPDLITLYANHTLASGMTLAAYVADQDTYDTAFGLGASYPLGNGAAIKASYEDRGTSSRASMGVTFGF